jgi:hypothetical protein
MPPSHSPSVMALVTPTMSPSKLSLPVETSASFSMAAKLETVQPFDLDSDANAQIASSLNQAGLPSPLALPARFFSNVFTCISRI